MGKKLCLTKLDYGKLQSRYPLFKKKKARKGKKNGKYFSGLTKMYTEDIWEIVSRVQCLVLLFYIACSF